MGDSKWRNDLDLLTEENLRELLKETKDYDYAISKAKNKGKAQIWVALAIINNKLNLLKMEKKEYKKKISQEEMEDIIDKLERL
ncbi:MAG: hypothetical protein KC589_01120 [Nanoarchaeota archaeon]|nr:hypothetical protein [Nanoarchaeota archaeon]